MKTVTNIKTIFMKYKLTTIIFLLASLTVFSQSVKVTKYQTGDCAKPDTMWETTTVTGTSGFFSTKVILKSVTTYDLHKYKPPIVVPPPTNNPPTVNAGAGKTINLTQGQTTVNVPLTATVSDESPATVTYLWSGLGLNSTTVASPIATITAPGSYSYAVTVKDNQGIAASDNVTVTVIAAPVIVDPPPTTTKKPELLAQFTLTGPIKYGVPIQNEIGTAWSTKQFMSTRTDQVTLVDEGRLPGIKGVRFVLKRTDQAVSGRLRAEITLPSKEKDGDDVYYGFSIKFNNYPSDDHPKSFFQIHDQDPSAGSPGFMIYARRGFAEMVLTQSTSAAAGQYEKGKNSENSTWYPQLTYGKKLPLQKWVDFVVRRKYSTTGQGIIQIWQDGVLVLSRMPGDAGFNGITCYPGIEYVKIGHYCHKWPDNFACPSGQKNPDGSTIDCYSVDMIYSNFKRYFAQPGETSQTGYDIVNPAVK